MISDIKNTAEDKMKKSVEALRVEFAKVRTGRANAGILDHVKVDYYGSLVPISQVANIRSSIRIPWACSLGKRR
jgi:ribosome recycling factor